MIFHVALYLIARITGYLLAQFSLSTIILYISHFVCMLFLSIVSWKTHQKTFRKSSVDFKLSLELCRMRANSCTHVNTNGTKKKRKIKLNTVSFSYFIFYNFLLLRSQQHSYSEDYNKTTIKTAKSKENKKQKHT